MQLIIPAYNEEARLPETLRALRAYALSPRVVPGRPLEVIVVDNASTDGTALVAAAADSPAMRVRVVHCPVRGKGAAVAAGVAVTTADVVGFMDADGATALVAFADAAVLLAQGVDVAIGSRAVAGAVTSERHSRARAFGARAYRSLAGRIVPGVLDTQCGFKLMGGDLARVVFADIATTGFSFDVEVLARARTLGARIAEFPVHWVDVPGSTFSPVRHGLDSFCALAVIAWRVRRPVRTPVTLPVRTPAALELAAEG
ncbi:glycosyltransferase [Nocardioides terrisoli]|uniref:glycosyltransferase n=1 Tax=Nocardioides terrisoli TaxID=3388267 RepID=UPI00287B6151|nr:glycosyltransferase [Nocardioides marmorisolisilvae]